MNALAVCLALAGCNSDRTAEKQAATYIAANETGKPAASSPDTRSTGDTPNTPDDGDTAENDGYPDLSPTPLEPELERTETGARNVLISFARAIELREFDQAWAMLDDADRARWSRSAWRDLFADLGKITVEVPGGTMEGAAGSSYYTSQATITSTDRDGRPIRYEGPIVLKRVNDVPGATAEQLRWHIESVKLDWTH